MDKSKKKGIIGLILILLFAGMAICAVVSINHYFDQNTWATILVSGEIHSDTADAFVDEHEYLYCLTKLTAKQPDSRTAICRNFSAINFVREYKRRQNNFWNRDTGDHTDQA